jgi:hypothetical protein
LYERHYRLAYAQVTNLNGGNADEDITYSIKGTNADKFSITTDTGILTYTEKQLISETLPTASVCLT